MRYHLLFASTLVLCSACTTAPASDPSNPYLLNERAIREVQAGRFGAAEILLERAVSIAPHELRIQRNRDTLRDYRAGHATVEEAPPSVPADASAMQGNPKLEPAVSLWPVE